MNERGDRARAALILGLAVLLSLVWFGRYLNFSPVASVDLPGHVVMIERLAKSLLQGRLFFYDHWWFCGWPAYQFYGVAGHFITALLLPVTSVLSHDPAQLAVHLVLLIGCALLPVSVYLAASALIGERRETIYFPQFGRSILALASSALTFWYLNSPLDFFGVGAGSLWHGGLYLQIFAWHLSLLFWAALFKLVHQPRPVLILSASVLLTILILTHIFAAVFSALLLALAFMRFDQARGKLLAIAVLSFGMSAFWWLPMVTTAGAYTLSHSAPPQGDLFEMIVRQPFAGFVLALLQLFQGHFVPVEMAPLLLILISLAAVSSRFFWNAAVTVAFTLFGLLALLLLSSTYVATSFPLGLHYYRFLSFLLLYLIVISVSSSFHLLRLPEQWRLERIARSLFLIFCVLSISMTCAIGELRGRAVSKIEERASFKAQHQMLALLRESAQQGRVGFEYFRNRSIFPFLSPHFMESSLAAMSGRETANGLFIQSSLATQFIAESMRALGFDSYRVPPPWGEEVMRDRALAREHLRDAGIGQLVVSSVDAVAALNADSDLGVKRSGPYHLVTLGADAPPLIEKVSKAIVMYDDRAGGVPFSSIEGIFYRDPELYRRTVLLATQGANLPGAIGLVHGGQVAPHEFSFQLPADRLSRVERLMIGTPAQLYQSVAETLGQKILPSLRALPSAAPSATQAESPPELYFAFDRQELHLKNLQPGALYRVAYSYFPYWQPEGGRLFRAIGEQMAVVAEGSSMVLRYTRLGDPLVLSATLLSFCSFFALMVVALWIRLRSQNQTRLAEDAASERGV